MKKILAIALAFMLLLAGCQNDLPSGGDSFSGFEGYTQELSDQELANAMKSGKDAVSGKIPLWPVWIFAAIAVTYGILRNIPFFDFLAPTTL